MTRFCNKHDGKSCKHERHNGTWKRSIPNLDLHIVEVPVNAAAGVENNLKGDAAVLRGKSHAQIVEHPVGYSLRPTGRCPRSDGTRLLATFCRNFSDRFARP